MKNVTLVAFLFLVSLGYSQESLSELLKKHNKNRVPYISVHELAMAKTNAVILDAREIEEYNVSHIKNAELIGYNAFHLDSLFKKVPNKNEKIVVYCSLGIRSEVIATKLKKAGYNHVFNLYGGIFEWKNNDFPVYDLKEQETDNVHAFSKTWSQWLLKGTKIY